jgi:hypothetical protein
MSKDIQPKTINQSPELVEKNQANTSSDSEKEKEWQYILVNGQSRQIKVKNPEYKKGKLNSFEDVKGVPHKQDEPGNLKTPELDDVEEQKRKFYADFFRRPFKNLLVLSGAGTSVDVGGLTMSGLWEAAENEFGVEDGKESVLRNILKEINYPDSENATNLESVLSHIEGYLKFSGEEKELKAIKQVNKAVKSYNLKEVRNRILEIIKERISKISIKEPNKFPHKTFIQRILRRKTTNPRVKIFTLNYDTLFEQAAVALNAVVIDGFSFTHPRTFSGRNFDFDIVQREGSKLSEEDNFIPNVFHLYKLHGSLDWRREGDGRIIIKENEENPLIIYPRDAKYENSYEQPFFEMFARFQRNLRINDDTLLICIGYSFSDKHVNAAILEALNQNPGFRLAVILPEFDKDETNSTLKEIRDQAEQSERIILVSETFEEFAKNFPEMQVYPNQVNYQSNTLIGNERHQSEPF